MSQLIANNLSCQRQQSMVFRHLSFSLSSGEMLLVSGQNGCGKSSLLRLITSLAQPASGDIQLDNQSIYQQPEYKNQLHYISHLSGIKLGLSCKENLTLALHLMREEAKDMDSLIGQALSLYQLSAKADTIAINLSAGQKRKLALARLRLIEKKLWILDEPLTALDNNTQDIFLGQLKQHLTKGGMAVLSSHQLFELKNYKVQSLVLEATC